MQNITGAVIGLCERHIGEFRIRNGQAVAKYCPFCKGGAHADTETFSIGLYNGAFSCLRGGCSKSGSFRELCEFFGETAIDEIALPREKTKKTYVKPDPQLLKPVTEEIITYFAKRRISETTLSDFNISADANGNIVFPFYRNSELVYVKYRKPQKHKKEDGPKEWTERNLEPILFGMDNVSFNAPLYITEGEIDALSLYEAGVHNVVSVPSGCNNFDWVTICWDWLERFQQIVLFGDSDEPGAEMVNTLMKRLGEDRCMLAPVYPQLVVNGTDMGRLCKDANEILYAYGPETLSELAHASEHVPIKGILNLADVNFIDPTSVPKIFTRIPELDNMIGGLCEGGVTIFSGKRGEGKSTLTGQLLLNAIQQGYSVCAYSGELSAQKMLEWIMLQAAESRYIATETDKRSGKKYAVVPSDIQKRIKDWINGKFFLFDNTLIDDCTQEESVLKVFTMCARRYACKVFLVDNLMTIISQNENEEIKAQGKFVASLKAFAVKYKVHVILVSHPRKTRPGDVFTNDDVSGSSVITNLADNVINVEKPNLRITKNRNYGSTGLIECNYDPANRRIYQANIGDRTIYGWDHTGAQAPEFQACNDPAFAIQYGGQHDIPF